jgi:hypothetical protein
MINAHLRISAGHANRATVVTRPGRIEIAEIEAGLPAECRFISVPPA